MSPIELSWTAKKEDLKNKVKRAKGTPTWVREKADEKINLTK